MEVGAVKQAFNNEVIQLKRNLNQAKIQTIHKLTRKAKTFAEKKAPDKLKEKLKRKAESAVNEVLIMKKVKPKDIAKFAVTHTGNLEEYLNKPLVDQDKACARLLLHKSLQEKYKYIRNTFSNIPINDLLMSRQERRKIKKEQQEQQKMKKDKKRKGVNAEGEWEVENIKSNKNALLSENELSAEDEDIESNEQANSEDETTHSDNQELNEEESQSDDENEEESLESVEAEMETDQETDNDLDIPEQSSDDDDDSKVGKFVRLSSVKGDAKPKIKNIHNRQPNDVSTSPAFAKGKGNTKREMKKPSKPKDANKNKNLNEKLLSRNFKKDSNEAEVRETKVVDPFFITSTGENYMSVAEARQPDEVKEIHKQGNRQLRRAAMFGHVPKIKPRSVNSYSRQSGAQGGFRNESNWSGDGNYRNNSNRNGSQFQGRNDNQFKGRNDNQFKGGNDNNFKGRNDNQYRGKNESNFKTRNNDNVEPKVEKLHPSWEAKKKKSGLLPFQGKKTVFEDS